MYVTPRIEFSNKPVMTLQTLIEVYSPKILGEQRKLENMLNDNDEYNEFRKEINLLIISLKANIPFDIITWKFDFETLFYILVRRLQEEFSIKEQAAQWAVSAWAVALEINEISEEKRIDDMYSLIKSEGYFNGSGSKYAGYFPHQKLRMLVFHEV